MHAAARVCKGRPGDAVDLVGLVKSPLTGVINGLHPIPPCDAVGADGAHYCSAVVADCGVLPDGGTIANAGANDAHLSQAVEKAVFEAIERYCAAFVDRSTLAWTKPDGPRFVVGDRLPLYAEFQYRQPGWPFVPLTAESEIYWVQGQSLRTGAPAMVPAPLVYLPYAPTAQAEIIGPSTSTGMAASWSRVAACTTGYFEVCERDAFIIMWMNRLSLPRLRVRQRTALDGQLRAIVGDADLVLVNLTNDLGVPVVMAVLRRPLAGRPAVALGLAARADYATACSKAVLEAAAEYERLRERQNDPRLTGWKAAPDFANVVDFEWHSQVYLDETMQQHLDFLVASPDEQVVEELPGLAGEGEALLAAALDRSALQLPDVVAVDLATREFRELGVHVVKVVAPCAVPLNADHRYPWLGHRRLYETSQWFGAPRRLPDELNPMPHPFS